jgi:hypothetical protein
VLLDADTETGDRPTLVANLLVDKGFTFLVIIFGYLDLISDLFNLWLTFRGTTCCQLLGMMQPFTRYIDPVNLD